MRDPNRISKVLEFFRENPAQLSMFLFNTKLAKSPILTEEFEKFWKESPDLRLGQAIIVSKLISDEHSWNKEEVQWLIEHGYF